MEEICNDSDDGSATMEKPQHGKKKDHEVMDGAFVEACSAILFLEENAIRENCQDNRHELFETMDALIKAYSGYRMHLSRKKNKGKILGSNVTASAGAPVAGDDRCYGAEEFLHNLFARNFTNYMNLKQLYSNENMWTEESIRISLVCSLNHAHLKRILRDLNEGKHFCGKEEYSDCCGKTIARVAVMGGCPQCMEVVSKSFYTLNDEANSPYNVEKIMNEIEEQSRDKRKLVGQIRLRLLAIVTLGLIVLMDHF